MKYEPDYADDFHERLDEARSFANEAKTDSADPSTEVEIPVAEDMAERCEALLEREYGDKIHGLAEHIRELESDERVDGREAMSLVLAEEFATGDLSKDFDNDAERVEAAIRTAIAILTEGVVAAPIEGIGVVEIDDNDDGTQFIRIPYFGPIRSAGGTAQAVSVLVADYVRDLLDIAVFKPRDEEVERYVEEIHLYDSATGMQYCPPKDEGRHIVRNTPIMVDGTPNANAVGREVDGYRDLERIEGNHPRDGMALVMAEGIALKAPKLQRYAEAFDLESWNWLDDLIHDDDDEDEDTSDEEESEDTEGEDDGSSDDNNAEQTVPTRSDEIETLGPKKKYMKDAIAGRPIFAGPSQEGGFRLRYGRGRNCGHAAVGFSPATMTLVDDFIAASTQLKTERPGKAAGAAPVDGIEGPTVRLDTGELKRVDGLEEAIEIQGSVEEIIDLGEIAVPYGEFEENNHPLAPASYAPDWWERDLEAAGGSPSNVNHDEITPADAVEFTQEYDIPLHPEYTYLWHDIDAEDYAALRGALNEATHEDEQIILPRDIYTVLESLLVPHTLTNAEVQMDVTVYNLINKCVDSEPVKDDVLGQVNDTAPFEVRSRAPTRIGARMGRPEKAERREMKPVVHSLFPIRDAGGNQRRVDKAASNTDGADHKLSGKNQEEYKGRGVVDAQLAHRICPTCEKTTWKMKCDECDKRTEFQPVCTQCGKPGTEYEVGDKCRACGGEFAEANYRSINVNETFQEALDAVNERKSTVGNVKSVKRLTSDWKVPEPLEKGVLRAKHEVSTFRDGTARYDMCDLPLTSFRPDEIQADVETVKQLGYEETLSGEPITEDSDLIELKMQDVIVCEDAGEYLLQVANYIDDLLEHYYDMDPWYDADEPEDLIGCFLIGMAPHTSAGVLGRLLGFTTTSANYAHPFFHAAKRRNCDGDEDSVMLLMDGLLNFSRTYLPSQRGKNMMDAPIVMSAVMDPEEIDDEAHNVDIVEEYSKEFFEATMNAPSPDTVDIEIAEDRLDNPVNFGHSLPTKDINAGPKNTAYKTLGGMDEKTNAQLELAEATRGISEKKVASLIVEKHFFPDIIGNLTAFSRQEMMCRTCGDKHRRAPSNGKCLREDCDGQVSLTVYEGMVDKYVETATDLADEYKLKKYTKQRLDAVSDRIDSLFQDDKEEQSTLQDYF